MAESPAKTEDSAPEDTAGEDSVDEAQESVATLKGAGPNALTQDEKMVGKTLKKSSALTEGDLAAVNSRKGLLQLLDTKKVNVEKALVKLRYEQELEKLQIELVKL